MIVLVNSRKLLALLLCSALILSALFLFQAPEVATEYEISVLARSPERVLIIDAGHGGADGGAQSAEGLLESEVNLDISLKMQALCALWGITSVMTRTTQDIDYPEFAATISAKKSYDQRQRLELINSLPDAVLISIHQNKFPDSRPKGSQVLYSATEGSKELGELMHANLVSQLFPENRRVAAPIPDTIYLMKMAKCPAVLVECAFLSNPEEAALLQTQSYKLKLAATIVGSYLQYEQSRMPA